MKICTSIEQSDHLYNVFKIDYKTSDCVYVITRNDFREDWKKLSQDEVNTYGYIREIKYALLYLIICYLRGH